jgi:hypothetical protein
VTEKEEKEEVTGKFMWKKDIYVFGYRKVVVVVGCYLFILHLLFREK